MKLMSKFGFQVIFPLILFAFSTTMICFMVYQTIVDFSIEVLTIYSIGITVLIAVWIWIVFGELRNKTITINITEDKIYIRGFMGIGPQKKYYLNSLDGFVTSNLPSLYNNYEYCYLIQNGRKVAKFSEFYHRNYHEIKAFIKTKIVFLGELPFNRIDELKEILK